MAYAYEDLFKQSSIPKKLVLEFDNGETFDNERIYAESMELTESICTTEELTFGSVESNCFKVTLSDTVNSHKGLWFNAYLVLNNNSKTKYQLGRYYVVEDKAQADHSKRNITAYDMLYQIVNTDVASWYNALTFPMTLKSFRTSFCAFIGVTEVDAVLVNDSMSIEKTIDAEELSGSDVLSSYCELCGVFPNINRNGKLEYITLPNASDLYEVVPRNDLYPADDLYPCESTAEHVYRSMYQTCTYDEFVTNAITKLQIRQEEGDVGAVSGTGDNCYIVQDNFLVYGKDATSLSQIANNLYNLISTYTTYRPYTVKAVGNPCVNVGEGVRISTTYEIIVSVILSRTLKGIQSLMDTYKAKGIEEYSEIVNDVNSSIVQLKGKTNKLTRTIDETQSELTNFESNTESNFTQTAKSIELKVSINDISNKISVETDQIKISGNRFVLSADNCSISKEGTITASNCNLTGKITATSGTIGGFTIANNTLSSTNCKISEDGTLTANNCNISGKITATSGTIGGFTLSNNSMVSSNCTISANGSITANNCKLTGTIYATGGTIGGFTLSNNSLIASNCTISSDGTITATNCNLSGKITANSGEIGGFTISSNSIHYGKTQMLDTENSGVFIGTDGIEIGGRWNNSDDNIVNIDMDNGIISTYSNFDRQKLPTFYSGTNSVNNPVICAYAGDPYRSSSLKTSYVAYLYPTKLMLYGNSSYYYTVVDTAGIASFSSGSRVAQLSTSGLIAPNATINGTVSATDTISSSGSIKASKDVVADLGICSKNGVYYYNGSSYYQRITYDSNGVTLGISGNKIGFFGDDGATKQSVGKITTASPTISDVSAKLNSLIVALQNYNLIS